VDALLLMSLKYKWYAVQVSENFRLKCDYNLSYVGKYDIYKVKLSLLHLMFVGPCIIVIVEE